MNKLIFVILLIGLYSCSDIWHKNRAEHHIEKAVSKNPSIMNDHYDTLTVRREILDTLWNDDSTGFTITKRFEYYDTIVKTINYDFSELKSWFQTWQENKTARTGIRQENRTERNESDNNAKIMSKLIQLEKVIARQQGRSDRVEIRNDFWSKLGKWLSAILVLILILWILNKTKVINVASWSTKAKALLKGQKKEDSTE